MTTILTITHIAVCLFLIAIVLLQHGKGADVGATFGGSSESLFGTEGPMPLMNKITTGVAIIFMVTSIALAYFSAHRSTGSVMSDIIMPPAVEKTERAEQQPGQVTIPMPAASAEDAAPPVDSSGKATE